MTFSIELWDFMKITGGLLVIIVASWWAFGKVLMIQFNKGLDQRFTTMADAHKEKDSAAHARLQGVEERTGVHDRRISNVESEMKHVPTNADIGSVYMELRTVSGGVQLLNGEMKALRQSVELITKHLLESH